VVRDFEVPSNRNDRIISLTLYRAMDIWLTQ